MVAPNYLENPCSPSSRVGRVYQTKVDDVPSPFGAIVLFDKLFLVNCKFNRSKDKSLYAPVRTVTVSVHEGSTQALRLMQVLSQFKYGLEYTCGFLYAA